jgi:hypothetical protein
MPLGSTSQLQAINMMLGTIGTAPINSLTGANSADVAMAKNVLDEISVAVQSMRWHFNTEDDVELTPNVTTKEISIPSNALLVDLDETIKVDVAIRGNRLYDLKNKTYQFDGSVKVRIVYALEWDLLPQPARHYIAVRAARVFQDRAVGSQLGHAFTSRDEFMALATLKDYDGETADRTIFDNYDTYRVIDRQYPHRGVY